jgi:hypothetical protein
VTAPQFLPVQLTLQVFATLSHVEQMDGQGAAMQ